MCATAQHPEGLLVQPAQILGRALLIVAQIAARNPQGHWPAVEQLADLLHTGHVIDWAAVAQEDLLCGLLVQRLQLQQRIWCILSLPAGEQYPTLAAQPEHGFQVIRLFCAVKDEQSLLACQHLPHCAHLHLKGGTDGLQGLLCARLVVETVEDYAVRETGWLQPLHSLGSQGTLAHASRPTDRCNRTWLQLLVQPSKFLLPVEKAGFKGRALLGDDRR